MSGHTKRNLFGAITAAVCTNILLLCGSASASVQINDVSSPDKYKDEVLGACVDMDDMWGAQCYDLFSNFHYSYTGRWLSSAGTGAAYGLWDDRYYNAGDEYELITDPGKLQKGDWVILGGGEFGHVGMAMGAPKNGYISLLGENQGGGWCSGGGSSANTAAISLANFRGAFRPKNYIKNSPKTSTKVEPKPMPKVEELEEIIEFEEDKPTLIIIPEETLSIGTKL